MLSIDEIQSPEFDMKYFYDVDDLGATFYDDKIKLRLWAPTAEKVCVNLFANYQSDAPKLASLEMAKSEKGTWLIFLDKKYYGKAYTYCLTFDNFTTETVDPYIQMVTINGKYGVLSDANKIKPENFDRMSPFSKATDAIIYETNVRDFTIDVNSGVKNKGKFLGMIESDTETPLGLSSGLDYLKKLGITHVQFMPIYDFGSIDESIPDAYNWGYDPANYNVPEGSFASDPADPASRIMEMKQMIKGLHDAGLRVSMDVVYNHVYIRRMHALEKTVPGYFFQYRDGKPTNGSACRNDVASERLMCRKYIYDSVMYWAKEYKLDGFRFDLMGILDVDTMNQIKRGLNEIDPSILVYGEGWDMRQTNHEIGAGQYNANKLPGISFFSDDFRDSIRGSEFAGVEPGLVFDMDHYGYYRASRMFIAGFLGGKFYSSLSNHPYQSPMQTINYVECHDNYTLFDKLKLLMPNIDEKEIHRRAKLALAMAILAEGIPFINSGQEAFRTKQGDPNSYSSGDQINKIDWNRMSKNKDDVLYLSELLKIRKKYDVFRLDDYSEIEKRIKLLIAGQNGLFAFSYDQNIIVIFNVFNDQKTNLGLDMTGFKKIFSSDADQDCHTVAPLSVNVFVHK